MCSSFQMHRHRWSTASSNKPSNPDRLCRSSVRPRAIQHRRLPGRWTVSPCPAMAGKILYSRNYFRWRRNFLNYSPSRSAPVYVLNLPICWDSVDFACHIKNLWYDSFHNIICNMEPRTEKVLYDHKNYDTNLGGTAFCI
jgi:hypothetical protein